MDTVIPHGTKLCKNKTHPVFDLEYWKSKCPLGDSRRTPGWIDSPRKLALIEQARDTARVYGDLGASIPSDMFVWKDAISSDPKPITQLGGIPWRSLKKKWPTTRKGVPLQFIGQICFGDSRDILPFELPGEVALIFAQWDRGSVWSDEKDFVLEWSDKQIKKPLTSWQIEPGMLLPFCYEGIVHRSVQYVSHEHYDKPFAQAGWKDGGNELANVQATSVGTYANLPQGWPYEEGDGNTLVATFSSFYFSGDWPLCNIRQPLIYSRSDGSEYESTSTNALSVGFGDAGAVWIYRDKKGKFRLEESCG
jgi:hypothetical protein